MRQIFLMTASVIGLTAMSNIAIAQDTGWYGGLEGGLLSADDERALGAQQSPDVAVDYENGWLVGAFAGYDFGLIRLEGEFHRQDHSLSALGVNFDGGLGAALGTGALSGPFGGVSGSTNANSIMLNGILDFETSSGWRPFVGLGAGVSRVSFKDFTASGQNLGGGRDWVGAVQGIFGIGHDLGDGMVGSLEYRYFATQSADIAFAGIPMEANLNTHAFIFRIGFKFGQQDSKPARQMERPTRPEPVEEPPVVEQAEPEPEVMESEPQPQMQEPEPEPMVIPGPFLVFFDWDSAILTSEGLDILRAAASAYNEVDVQSVIAIGHADTSGPAWYNDRLSVRRAIAVRDALIRLGVNESDIEFSGRGENDLLVQTPDNIREPRNRRVEITLGIESE